ncbi:hypothetical protein AVEN_20549-1 [Araneus ventricosus]|uniref:Uncharacterized protein n=1 Tax=Araneus ventricosus TaxID=182803 RepID=A0A4Y2AS86_ARAVE|nr:hypothetical protein AVEN_20549-1 [Araneus ventricosus]
MDMSVDILMLKEGKGKIKDRFYSSQDLENSNLVIECKKNPFSSFMFGDNNLCCFKSHNSLIQVSFMRLVVVTQLQGSIERENYKQCNCSSHSTYFPRVAVQCDDEPLSCSFNLSVS